MQILVVGVHRSGTSLITRLVHGFGLAVGAESDLDPPNWSDENPRGFWEHRGVRQLNVDLMASQDCDWDRVLRWREDALKPAALADFHTRAHAITAQLDERGSWVGKDPRFSLTARLWLAHVREPRLVWVLRHPMEVALSLKARNDFPVDVGLALWEFYNRRASELVEWPRLVIDYGETMKQPRQALAQLGHWLGCEPEDAPALLEFVDSSLYRSKSPPVIPEQHRAHPAMRLYREILEQRDEPPRLDAEISDVSRRSLERHERVVDKLHRHLRKIHRREFESQAVARLSEQRARLLEQLRRAQSFEPGMRGTGAEHALEATEAAFRECLEQRQELHARARALFEQASEATAQANLRGNVLSQIGQAHRAVMDSARWRLGDAAVRLVELSLLRSKPRLAAEDISDLLAKTPTSALELPARGAGPPRGPERVEDDADAVDDEGGEDVAEVAAREPSGGAERVEIILTAVSEDPDCDVIDSLQGQRRKPDRATVEALRGSLEQMLSEAEPIGDRDWRLIMDGGTRLAHPGFLESVERVLRAEGSGCLRFATRDYFTGLPTQMILACSGDRLKHRPPRTWRTLWTDFERGAIRLPNPSPAAAVEVGLRLAVACRDPDAGVRDAASAERELIYQHYRHRRGLDLLLASLAAETTGAIDGRRVRDRLCAEQSIDELEFELQRKRDERCANTGAMMPPVSRARAAQARVVVCGTGASAAAAQEMASALSGMGVQGRVTSIGEGPGTVRMGKGQPGIPLALAERQPWDLALAADGDPLTVRALNHFQAPVTAAIIQPGSDVVSLSRALEATAPTLVFAGHEATADSFRRWAPRLLGGLTPREIGGVLLDAFDDVILASAAVRPPPDWSRDARP